MSADDFYVFTYEYPDPRVDPSGRGEPVNSNISYTYDSPSSSDIIRTLSTNAATSASNRQGFLYVPDLDSTDPCRNASRSYFPENVTRLNDLPSNLPIVAIAPWLSPTCTETYLRTAASHGVAAFVFFLPNGTSDLPPAANDPVWGLGDGGQWKQNNPYPVYAIPAPIAADILNHSALYSGNITTAPFATTLRTIYGSSANVRLFVRFDLASSNSGIPSIWIFLLIILAVLLIAVGLVSFVMHMILRRRRQTLRRRIAEGHVDLEALGVKDLVVPQEIINAMPVYAYTGSSLNADSSTSNNVLNPDSLKPAATSNTANDSRTGVTPVYHQPTCAICLDDFVPQETLVRELPCHHIFHPSCIDTFLLENSAQCPLCKKSTLPRGYCPPVSNIMVRRERNIRQRDQRVATTNPSTNTNVSEIREPAPAVVPSTDMEMTALSTNPGPLPPHAPAHHRTEWARRRALALLGPRATASEQGDNHARTPGSRPMKLLRSIFPGVG